MDCESPLLRVIRKRKLGVGAGKGRYSRWERKEGDFCSEPLGKTKEDEAQ